MSRLIHECMRRILAAGRKSQHSWRWRRRKLSNSGVTSLQRTGMTLDCWERGIGTDRSRTNCSEVLLARRAACWHLASYAIWASSFRLEYQELQISPISARVHFFPETQLIEMIPDVSLTYREYRSPSYHLCQNAPDCPDIHRRSILSGAKQKLWSTIPTSRYLKHRLLSHCFSDSPNHKLSRSRIFQRVPINLCEQVS